MCRICGRMVRCIFDSMPSRTISRPAVGSVLSSCRRSIQCQSRRQIATASRRPEAQRAAATPTRTIMQLPLRSLLHTTTIQQATVEPSMASSNKDAASLPPSMLKSSAPEMAPTSTIPTTIVAPEAQDSSNSKPLVLSKSLQDLLPALRAQAPHYVTAHIHSFPYLLTEGDTLRLPFHMKGVNPGDILRFNRATILGSRDYTLKAGYSSPQHTSPPHVRGEVFANKRRTGEPSYIDERLFECRMRVMGLDSTPMMVTEKKKRRNRRTRRVASKHKYTVLRVMEVRVKSLEEIMNADGVQVVLE